MFFSCEQNNIVQEEHNYIDSETISALEQMKTQGKIKNFSVVDKNTLSVTYPEGNSVFIESHKSNIKVFDSKRKSLFNASFEQSNSNGKYSLKAIEFNQNTLSPINQRNPEHPDGQTICECYASDVSEFCDGIIGCASLVLPAVHAVILAHCAYKTGGTACAN